MDDRLIDRILSNVSLVSYLENEVGVALKAGEGESKELKGSCFNKAAHQNGDRHPSMHVNSHKGVFRCKGCGIAGNVVDAYSIVQGISKLDAKMELARRYHLLEEREISEPEAMLAWAAKQFAWNLKNIRQVEPAVRYLLEERKLTWETIERFGIGYCWGNEFTKGEPGAAAVALEAGLVWPPRKDESGQEKPIRAQMAARITFPIHDRTGRVIGFGGRVVPGGFGSDGPKYLNTAETKLFKKSEVLYGAHLASAGVSRAGYAVLVEGYMDVIGLHQAGMTNAMAVMGAGANDKAFENLWRMTRRVVFALDPDAAGREGVVRTIKATAATMPDGGEIGVMEIPEGLDPDEYVLKSGKDAFAELCDQAQPLSQFLVGLVAKDYNLYQAEHRARFLIAVEELSQLFTKAPTVRAEIVAESKAIASAAVVDVALSFAGMEQLNNPVELESAISLLQARLQSMTSTAEGRPQSARPR